jgi:hypothetical protein
MPDQLILKRDPNARYTESYNVLFEGRCVGRIYKAVSHAPREAPWFWGLDFLVAGKRWAAVWERRQSRSGNEGVPRRVGSQAEGEREGLGPHPRTIATCVRANAAQSRPQCVRGTVA